MLEILHYRTMETKRDHLLHIVSQKSFTIHEVHPEIRAQPHNCVKINLLLQLIIIMIILILIIKIKC